MFIAGCFHVVQAGEELRLTGSDSVVGGGVRSNSCLGALDRAEHAGDRADGGHDAGV